MYHAIIQLYCVEAAGEGEREEEKCEENCCVKLV